MSHARRWRLSPLLGLLPAFAGCIASNVVAVTDREVPADPAALPFAPAGVVVLDGLWESVDIRGDAAVALRRIWYQFAPVGTYTAAALADVAGKPAFQTLSGSWQSTAAGLVLDGAPPVALERAPDHLRLTAPNGVVVLRRVSLQ